MKCKSNNNVVYSCKYHVVWCPKYRRKVLAGDVEARLKELVKNICDDLKVELLEMDAMPVTYISFLKQTHSLAYIKLSKQSKGELPMFLRNEFKHLTTSC